MNTPLKIAVLSGGMISAALNSATAYADEPAGQKPSPIATTTAMNPPVPVRPASSMLGCPSPKYPVEAEIYELQGPVVLRFMIGEDGKVKQVKVSKSSGWRILDMAAKQSLSDCQFEKFESEGKPSSYWTSVRYVWKMDEADLGTKPVLLPETCEPSGDLSFAKDDEVRSDIRLRFRMTEKGRAFGIKIENTSGNAEADQRAISLLESCQFSPSIYKEKPREGASSLRFFWEGNSEIRKILHSNEALSAYREEYAGKPNHKAFTQSAKGAWAWVSSQDDVDKAKKSALDSCNSHVKPEDPSCEVINADGQWQIKAGDGN